MVVARTIPAPAARLPAVAAVLEPRLLQVVLDGRRRAADHDKAGGERRRPQRSPDVGHRLPAAQKRKVGDSQVEAEYASGPGSASIPDRLAWHW